MTYTPHDVGEGDLVCYITSRVVYGANHRAGQRPGKTGPPRPLHHITPD
jgi:hypothetical protein